MRWWLLILSLLVRFLANWMISFGCWQLGPMPIPELNITEVTAHASSTSQPPPQTTDLNLVFSDDFSDDLSQWELIRGDWSDWQLVDGWLQGTADSWFIRTELVPKDAYWHNWGHYLFEFDYQVIAGEDRNWVWGFEDFKNWYEVHLRNQYLHLTRVINGFEVLNVFEFLELIPGETYHVMISFNQGRIQLWVDGQMLADRQDHRYNQNTGKISLKTTSGVAFPTQVRFDNVKVYDLGLADDKLLPIELLKQHDARWRDHEYDHAADWAETDGITIQRWGCALTSLAMVLRYFDLVKLPDGQELTPATLNRWLKSQPDGYIQGGVNWLAGSRLSREISDQYSNDHQHYPWLKFQRKLSSEIEEVLSIIDEQRPAIIQIPGHFLVANGYPVSKDDLTIADPAYSYDRFSQHQEQIMTINDYYPVGDQDLSYLWLTAPAEVELGLYDQEQELVAVGAMAVDTIEDAVSNERRTPSSLVRYYWPSLPHGKYQLQITKKQTGGESQQPFMVQIYFYDQLADFRQAVFRGVARVDGEANSLSESSVELNFDPVNLSDANKRFSPSLVEVVDFEQFSTELNQAQQQGELLASYVARRLQRVVDQAQQSNLVGQADSADQVQIQGRYQQRLLAELIRFRSLIAIEAWRELVGLLD